MEEKAELSYKWSGWRKQETQTISQISFTNFANEISYRSCPIEFSLCHEKNEIAHRLCDSGE